MKKFVILCTFLTCILSSAVFAAKMMPVDRIVVIVNKSVITQSEVDKATTQAKQQMLAGGVSLPKPKVLRKQVIDSLINQEILRQLAKRVGIKVEDAELTRALKNIAHNNKTTVKDLKQTIKAQGGDYKKFENNIKEQLLFQKIISQAVGPGVSVTESEVTAYLHTHAKSNKEYRLRDVVLKTKQEAQKMLLELKKGDKSSKVGADLGWRPLAGIPTIFVGHVKKMQKGQVVGPIKAPNGFHVIKLVDIRAGKSKLTKNQTRNLLYQQKMAKKRGQWLKKMRQQVYIKIMQ